MFAAKFCPTVYISCIYPLWPAEGLGAMSVAVCTQDLLKKVPILFIIFMIVWSQSNNREVTEPCPSTKNWIKDLLNMAPIQTQIEESRENC